MHCSSAAFNSFTGVATICLSTSYAIPIFISLLRGRKLIKNSAFPLGKLGIATNVITVLWICLAVVLFCMPVSRPITPQTMNYASVVFAGFATISIAWYFIHGRTQFSGPPVTDGGGGGGGTREEVVGVPGVEVVDGVMMERPAEGGGTIKADKTKKAELGR